MYVLSKAEKRRRRWESREYVGRWRKNQVTMVVAAKLGETFLLLLDDRQLAVVGSSGWDRRSFLVGAILNSANFHESFFATHPSYHNVEGPKIGRPTNVATEPCLGTYVCIPCSWQFILCNCSGSGGTTQCNAAPATLCNNHNLARQKIHGCYSMWWFGSRLCIWYIRT